MEDKKKMPTISVHRYALGEGGAFAGWVEPEDKSWILFIKEDGSPEFFGKRDPKTGTVLADVYSRMTDEDKARFVSAAPGLPPGVTTFYGTTPTK